MSFEYSNFCPCIHIPQTHRAVNTPRTCDYFPIRTERYTIDSPYMFPMSVYFHLRSHIPQTHNVEIEITPTGYCEGTTIWTENNTIDTRYIKFNSFCLGSNIPQTHGLPIPPIPICDCISIGTERYTFDTPDIKCTYFCLGINIPQNGAAINTPSCEYVSIWTERYTIDIPDMPLKYGAEKAHTIFFHLCSNNPQDIPCMFEFGGISVCLCLRSNIPETHNAQAIITCDCFSIWIERYTLDIIEDTHLKYAYFCLGSNIPQTHVAIITPTCDCFAIRTKCYTIDSPGMSLKYRYFCQRIYIP